MMSSPTSYPCGACRTNVRKNKALQCEGTCQWFQCTCIFGYKLSTTQYRKIEASADAWVCANCCGNQTLPHFLLKSVIDVFHFNYQKTFQCQN